MSYPLKVIVLDEVEIFRKCLSEKDRSKINASILAIRFGEYESIYVKPLKGVLRELIIKRFRFLFFINKDTVYFVNAFIKKTNKTPKIEIENAEKIYKIIIKI
jgi:phage-related protein